MQKRHFWKRVAIYFGIIVLVLGGLWSYSAYKIWREGKDIQNLADALQKAQDESYRRAFTDRYGGRTPKETLKMYIDAVEKGDYELASKYFIGDYQQKELDSLHRSSRTNIEAGLVLLREDLKSEGSYSLEKDRFGIRKPLFVDFKVYPNGIWKIIEI